MPGSEELAGNALNLPVRLFHGDQDPLVPAASSRQWQKRFLDVGVAVDYVEFPGVRHNAWTSPIAGAAVRMVRRAAQEPAAGTRSLLDPRYRYRSAYWVRIDELTPGVLASVDAVRTGSDVKLTTQNVGALTITGPARTVSVDGVAVRLACGRRAVIRESGSALVAGDGLAGGQAAGTEGPIVDALRGRHIWVYGTAGSANEEELGASPRGGSGRRDVVQRAGASECGGRGQGRSRRDRGRNRLGEFAAIWHAGEQRTGGALRLQLPMELNPGAADYGMVLIAPEGGRYLVVSAGLPWWTGAEEADRGGYRFAPAQYRLLSTFPIT